MHMLSAVHQLDFHITKALVDFGIAHPLFGLLAYISAEELILLIILALVWMWYWPTSEHRKLGHRKIVVLTLLSIVFALAAKTAITLVYFRARPFITHPEILALPVHVDPASFPSGHSLIAWTIVASIWFGGLRKQGFWLGVLAVFVSLGRVAIGVHYPTDVIGGAVIGIGIAWFLHRESSSLKRYLPAS